MVLNSNNNMTMKEMETHIGLLVELAKAEDIKGIKEELKRIVPEYTPQF
jgi:hypothetical protein